MQVKRVAKPNFAKHKPNPYYSSKKTKDLDTHKQEINTDINKRQAKDKQAHKQKINSSDSYTDQEQKNVLRTSEKPHDIEQLKEEMEKNGNRGTRLRRDWKPDPELKEFCTFETSDLNFDEELADFIDYWIAVPGAKGVKLDWNATFRGMLRKHQKWANERKKSPLSAMERMLKQDEADLKREAESNGHKKKVDAQTFFDEDELL